MANLVNYALAYAEKGMSVLPMVDKQPLIKFADKPPLNSDEIKEIWGKHPDAQLALRTTNFFVVDIDRHDDGADGFQTIENYERKELLKSTLSQKTAGGGCQLFYLKRDDIEVRQNIGWLPGVDIKAHENNYVLISPSEINGKKYEWENHNPIVTPSKKLIQLINQRENKSSVDFTNYNSGTKTATTKLFESLVNGLGDNGSRNNELTSLIGGLLYRNVEADMAYQLAVMANENTPDPLPDKELNRTFESMLDKDIRRRGGGEV
ncbi:bifunctional DNA primase/polymerase [Lactobacillus terrae]|uniref:bifunctional DNA primase/polymerase n=1 Tax=Lactobacillus terrae TaxID=2269374 RepID=UPI000C1B6257|nr:bifunctional DNA primase/polymerase [Lactobacillus terrae]